MDWTNAQCLSLVSRTQYQVLEHLAETAIRQKEEARATKRKFRGGWTYVRSTQHIKLATLNALKRLGLIETCCHDLHGADLVRISRRGVEFLEHVVGSEIMA